MTQPVAPDNHEFAPPLSNFERGRRLSATRSIAFTFGALLTLLTLLFAGFVAATNLLAKELLYVAVTFVMLIGCVILYGTGGWFAQRGRLQEGVIATLSGTLLSIILMTLFWKLLLSQGVSNVLLALLAACGVGIVLAGTLGEHWMVYTTTLIMNGLAIVAIGFFPLAHGELWLALIVALAIQWAITAITLASSRNYRTTLTELGTAYTQIQQLDSLKDQFITNINHELRTPIMALQGYIDFLQKARAELSTDELDEVINRANRAGNNLVKLLSSILDNRRLDQGAENFTPVPVPLLENLQTALTLLDAQDLQRGQHRLEISIPKNWTIQGDAIRLQQIYLNLISNAIKYSPSNTPIQISARMVQSKGNRSRGASSAPTAIETIVRDYGLGIPPKEVPLLFNRFARLPRDLASNVVGNGLGLYLCRVLARAMGGDITVESTGIEGEGTAFHVVLPIATPLIDDQILNEPVTDPKLQVVILGEV